MKLKYKTSKIGLLATFIGMLFLASCKDDYPVAPDSSSNMVVLNSIKLMNAGVDGSTVLEGVVDENTKTVSFPRIDPNTNFSNLKFEAGLSDGAKLDQETYPVKFDEGKSEQVIVVKVLNSPRYREYLVKLRLKVPVFGADFEKGTTYDFTSNPIGNPIYDAFTGALTRSSGFDGKQVMIGHRTAAHILNVSDLKAGVINKIPLNMTGVPGVYSGDFVNGHSYLVNLSGGTDASGLKVYHWADPSAAPQLIVNVTTIAGAGTTRYGDNFSASLDDKGNGYFFLGNNAGNRVLRFSVTNYSTVSDPVSFAVPTAAAGSWTSYNRIGNTAEYLFTGHAAPIALVSDGGTASFTMSGTNVPLIGSGARIVNFNSERYLIVTTAARSAGNFTNFMVYDITNGETVKDALTNLNNLPTATPIFNYSLMGPINTSPASQTGFYVKKDANGIDESLMLYSAASDAGFVFFEIPKKVALD